MSLLSISLTVSRVQGTCYLPGISRVASHGRGACCLLSLPSISLMLSCVQGTRCLPGISLMLSRLWGMYCLPGISLMLSRVQSHLGEEKAAMLGFLRQNL